MSLFQQLVFKTFLILALFCFFSSSVFAATKTYYYYISNDGLVKSESEGPICTHYIQKNSTNTNYRYQTCYVESNQVRLNREQFNPNDNCTFPPGSTTLVCTGKWVANGYVNVGYKSSLTCTDPQVFKIIDNNASCVADPCKELQGQQFSKTVQCGSVTCPNGGVIVDNGILSCSKGAALWLPQPLQSTSDTSTSCVGNLVNSLVPTSVQVKSSSVGSSSTTGYCSATYTHQGSSGSATASENDLVSMAFSSITETTEDGQCPSGTKKGSYAIGENGATKWVCVPDSGSPPDPTDPNPTTCPTGQHKDATGQCVPDTNTGGGGDNTGGGDGDNSGGGDNTGGGGGGGGSGGSGGDSPNIDDTKGEEGSGSQTGAGGKATASTAEGCTTPPSCSGDPLQCAAFVQDWKQNCQMMSVSQGDADKANALSKASNDEHKAKLTQQEQKVSGFFSDFRNTANASTTSQCPNDINLAVMGKSITLNLSQTCDFWRFLRILIIASAYLAAARIVFGSLN